MDKKIQQNSIIKPPGGFIVKQEGLDANRRGQTSCLIGDLSVSDVTLR